MKTVFLLGSNGDIGKAIYNKFINNGYEIIAPSSSELNLEDRESIEKYFTGKSFNINILIQCAGWNNPKSIENLTYDDIDKTFSINTTGFYRIIQHLLPCFKEKNDGYILAISSLYGSFAREKRLPYVMSKHALEGLVKTVAIELGQYNIKVNSLSPGFVDTKMTRKNNSPEKIRQFEEKIPLNRLAQPSDIANVAYFLCSNENNYINGQNIIVDGGYSIGGFQN